MIVHHLPDTVASLIFDIDQTLYDHPEYYASQSQVQFERLARELGKPLEETREMVENWRREQAQANGGEKPSLANSFAAFGIPTDTSARWRDELYRPEDYLQPDPALRQTLETLATRFRIAAVTNSSTGIGRRTLETLGVTRFFDPVHGLDITGESKPTMLPFRRVAEAHGAPLDQCVSIGDRYHVDLELPLAHGMGGILVQGMQDVYDLPRILGCEG